jgi:hypothetical protein
MRARRCGRARRAVTYNQNALRFPSPRDQINFGMMDQAKARRSMELFAKHVLPRFR